MVITPSPLSGCRPAPISFPFRTWSRPTFSEPFGGSTAFLCNASVGRSGSSSDAKFQTDGIDLFVEELGKLINASSDGQTAIAAALRASLARVEHDEDGLASRLFPFVRGEAREPKVIVVDPRLSFGRPVVAKTGVPVSVIVGRYRAGENVSTIADDYGISVDQTHDAIRTAIPAAA